MSWKKPTARVRKGDLDRLLAWMPVVEDPNFVLGTWGSHLGPDYHPFFDAFWRAMYDTSLYIDGYAALPGDGTEEDVPFSVLGVHETPEAIAAMTPNQVRRYLVLITRGERFCDGHALSCWESGSFLAALRRLREWRSGMV